MQNPPLKSQAKIPILLDKRSFVEQEYYMGRFNKYEKSPVKGEQLQYYEDEFKAPRFMTKINKSIFTAPAKSYYWEKKRFVLIEKKDGKIFISGIAKELVFTHKEGEDAEEIYTKTLMMMKNRKINKAKKRKPDGKTDGDDSEGRITRFASGARQRA